MADDDIDHTLQAIQDDYLVKVFLGEISSKTKPILVQYQLLMSHDGDITSYLQQLLDETDPLHHNDAQTILIKSGDFEVWTAFFKWVISVAFPGTKSETSLLVRCWNFGEEHNIPDFQDTCMTGLLRRFEARDAPITAKELKLVFESKSEWSELKELAIEETVKRLYYDKVHPKEFGLKSYDGIPGLMSAIVHTSTQFNADKDLFFKRFTKKSGQGVARWEHFMVDGGHNVLWNLDENGRCDFEVKGQKWWEPKAGETEKQ